jgi:hypothetical protein
VSVEQRHVRSELAVRESLVRTRTRYVALIKAAVRREELRLSQGDPERTVSKLEAIELREEVLQEISLQQGRVIEAKRRCDPERHIHGSSEPRELLGLLGGPLL